MSFFNPPSAISFSELSPDYLLSLSKQLIQSQLVSSSTLDAYHRTELNDRNDPPIPPNFSPHPSHSPTPANDLPLPRQKPLILRQPAVHLQHRKLPRQAEGAHPWQPISHRGEGQVLLRGRNTNQQALEPAAARQHRAVPRHVQEQAQPQRLRLCLQGVRRARSASSSTCSARSGASPTSTSTPS